MKKHDFEIFLVKLAADKTAISMFETSFQKETNVILNQNFVKLIHLTFIHAAIIHPLCLWLDGIWM